MTDGPSPTLRRRKLGKELRRHREAAKLTVRQIAPMAHLQPGTISKIENGKQAILPRNVKLILQACGVGAPTMDTLVRLAEESDDRSWWAAYSDVVPDGFATYVDLESDAEEIWTYTSELVDGLLQTGEYAEAIVRASHPAITSDELRRFVELRQARQSHVQRRKPARLQLVLNEAVIKRVVGNSEVMRHQLAHLAKLAAAPTITIQVLPFSSGAHPGMKCPFTLLRFPEGFNDMDCVYLENENGELWQERPSDIADYSAIFRRLQTLSLSPENTIALLDSLA